MLRLKSNSVKKLLVRNGFILNVLFMIQAQHAATYRQCECGKSNDILVDLKSHDRIIGGTTYYPHKYPWLVLLQLNGTFLCGGTVISDQYVVSAAHCLSLRFHQSLLKVVLGEHNRCQADIETVTFSVASIIKHRKFNPKTYSADIMLLKLNIARNVVVRHSGRLATVVGWGKRHSQANKPSCAPRELQIPVLENRHCGSRLQYSLFCAGYLEGGHDSCQGDSGGPLQVQNKRNRYELIGIVSSGIGCALPNHPGLYTDVLRYLPWIRQQTEGDIYCS